MASSLILEVPRRQSAPQQLQWSMGAFTLQVTEQNWAELSSKRRGVMACL